MTHKQTRTPQLDRGPKREYSAVTSKKGRPLRKYRNVSSFRGLMTIPTTLPTCALTFCHVPRHPSNIFFSLVPRRIFHAGIHVSSRLFPFVPTSISSMHGRKKRRAYAYSNGFHYIQCMMLSCRFRFLFRAFLYMFIHSSII